MTLESCDQPVGNEFTKQCVKLHVCIEIRQKNNRKDTHENGYHGTLDDEVDNKGIIFLSFCSAVFFKMPPIITVSLVNQ